MDRAVNLCKVDDTLEALSGKWKLVILLNLVQNDKMRFSDFLLNIPKITKKMLSKNLKELEDDDIVERISYPVIPPKVEYSLTEHGKTLVPIIDSLHFWGIEHRKHIQEKWLK